MIGCPCTGVLNWGSVQFVTDGEIQSVAEAIDAGVTDGILWEFKRSGESGYYDFPANPVTGTLRPFTGRWVHVMIRAWTSPSLPQLAV